MTAGNAVRSIARWMLAALLLAAGASHLTWGRRGYRIVVPDWAPRATGLDKDAIVIASGAAELMLGAGLAVLPGDRPRLIRLFLQPVLVAWALWSTRSGRRS